MSGIVPRYLLLLPGALLTFGEADSERQAFFRKLPIRRVEKSSKLDSNEYRRLAEGAEIVRLR